MNRCITCIFLVAFAVYASWPNTARSHWPDLSLADMVVLNNEAQVLYTLPASLLQAFDDDNNGNLSDTEITTHQQAITSLLQQKFVVRHDNEIGQLTVTAPDAATLTLLQQQAIPASHTTLFLVFKWDTPITEQLVIDYDLFVAGGNSAKLLLSLVQGTKTDSFVFTPNNTRYGAAGNALWAKIGSFVLLGAEHIIEGIDHVLFLITLLMAGGNFRYLLGVVTAFTVAHSLTISLAVLNIVHLPDIWVELAVALSIVYVSIENIVREKLSGRWIIVFLFGLMHGMGFAGILKETPIPENDIILSLISFNVGVEIGQVLIVSAAYLVLMLLRRLPHERRIRQGISVITAIIGAVWFAGYVMDALA